jgi:hypothetical protein
VRGRSGLPSPEQRIVIREKREDDTQEETRRYKRRERLATSHRIEHVRASHKNTYGLKMHREDTTPRPEEGLQQVSRGQNYVRQTMRKVANDPLLRAIAKTTRSTEGKQRNTQTID